MSLKAKRVDARRRREQRRFWRYVAGEGVEAETKAFLDMYASAPPNAIVHLECVVMYEHERDSAMELLDYQANVLALFYPWLIVKRHVILALEGRMPTDSELEEIRARFREEADAEHPEDAVH